MFFFTTMAFSQLSINEVSYYSFPKFIEISGPVGLDLTGWRLNFYEGKNIKYISTLNLSGSMPVTPTILEGNISLLSINTPDLSYESPPGGFVLLLNGTTPIQLLAFQGAPAATVDRLSSVDIGSVTSPNSIQYDGTNWIAEAPTKDQINVGQTLSVVRNNIEGLAVYPNPVINGKFSISSNINVNKQVEIHSLLGKLVYNKEVKGNETILISNLNKGIYILRVEEEGKISTRKLVVN